MILIILTDMTQNYIMKLHTQQTNHTNEDQRKQI